MKEQDARIDYEAHQLILYVEKDNGSYGPVQTGSYISKNYIDDYWYKRKNLEQGYIEKIKKGVSTPIEMYMILEELSLAELAARVGLSRRLVKKHCDPKHYASITLEELGRYAEVFDVPLVNFFQLIVTQKNDLQITLEKTDTSYFTILKVGEHK